MTTAPLNPVQSGDELREPELEGTVPFAPQDPAAVSTLLPLPEEPGHWLQRETSFCGELVGLRGTGPQA